MALGQTRMWAVCLLLIGTAWAAAQNNKQAPSATSPDGKLLAVGDGKILSILDVATGKEIRRMAGHTEAVTAIVFSPDGKLVVTGGADKSILVWDMSVGKLLIKVGVSSAIEALGVSQDGRTLTSKEADKTTREIDLATGKVLRVTK